MPIIARLRSLCRQRGLCRIAIVAALVALPVAPGALAQPSIAAEPSSPTIPQGVWLMDGRVAVQIFPCKDLICGRIVWLHARRNPHSLLNLDTKNPEAALRGRELCGLTILWGLRPAEDNRWTDGWFYNPDDGKTYRVAAQIVSDDKMVARIYVGLPLFGKTKTLARVPHDTTDGWC